MKINTVNLKTIVLIFFLSLLSFKAISQSNETDKLTKQERYFLNGLQEIMYNKNYDIAIDWLRKSSNLKYELAIQYLGDMYYEGKVIPKNYDEAIYWLKKGAKIGDSRSMYFLGLIYSDTSYVKYNEKKAKKWFEKSSLKGYLLSKDALHYIKIKDSINNKLILKLLAESKNKMSNSMFELGKIYLTSIKFRDLEKGYYWIKQSTRDNSNPVTYYYLGFLYGEGIAAEQSFYDATWSLRQSVSFGYLEARELLMYYTEKMDDLQRKIFFN